MAKTVRLKLNRYLDERRISRYALAKMSGIKYQTIDHYYKNWVVRYDSATLGEIITALDCGIEDILEVVEEEEPEEPGGPRHMARASGFLFHQCAHQLGVSGGILQGQPGDEQGLVIE